METRTHRWNEDEVHERLGRIVNDAVERRSRGEGVDIDALCAEHPDLAENIRAHLELTATLQRDEDPIAALVASGVLAASDSPASRARLGDYEVKRQIGRGGMGIVVEAYDPQLDRTVALKVLRPDLAADRTCRKRFEIEARAAAATQHPHVITVHGIGEQNGAPFIVMEYVRDGSLADLLRSAPPLSTTEVRRLLSEILAGLNAAHQCGLLHRDIKPSNILLDGPDRRAKVADFGLARIASNQITITQHDSLLGTPEYMSPEQIRGDRRIDQRTDLYSVGVVLHEMLTGTTPFRSETPTATIHRIMTEEPRDPCRLATGVDLTLARIALRLMAKDPADRFQSAAEVLAALNSGSSVALPHRRRRTRRTALFAGAALLLVMLIAAPVAYFLNSPLVGVSIASDGQRLLGRYANQAEPRPLNWLPDIDAPWKLSTVGLTAGIGPFDDPVVLAANKRAIDSAGNSVVALQAGHELWRLDFTPLGNQWIWPDNEQSMGRWEARHVVAADFDGTGPQFVVFFSDTNGYPGALVRLDPHTGAIHSTFWHWGNLNAILVVEDFFADGRPALVARGVNNKLDGFNQPQEDDPDRMLVRLDPHMGAIHSEHDDDPAEAPTKYEMVHVVMILDPLDMDGLGPPHVPERIAIDPAPCVAYAFLDLASASGQIHSSDGEEPEEIVPADQCVDVNQFEWFHSARAGDPDHPGHLVVSFASTEDRPHGRVRFTLDHHLRPVEDRVVVEDYERHLRTPEEWLDKWHVLIPSDGDD